jgi:hypothetical protein
MNDVPATDDLPPTDEHYLNGVLHICERGNPDGWLGCDAPVPVCR